MENTTFDPDLVHAIFKHIWARRTERDKGGSIASADGTARVGISKRSRPTSANANALKPSCELLRSFVTEAIRRASAVAEAEVLLK